MPKLTSKSDIEDKYWLEFVKWAKKNPVTNYSTAGTYHTSRPLTNKYFWSWYSEVKL